MIQPTSHVIFEALNKPMLILGVDRRIFALGLFLGLLCYWWIHGLKGMLSGLVCGMAAWVVGKIGAAKDPEFFNLFRHTVRLRKEYRADRK